MGKSQSLSACDLRSLYLLIGECKELGADPVALRIHLLRGLLRILDAAHGSCFEMERVIDPGPIYGSMRLAFFVDTGLTDADVRRAYRDLTLAGVEFTCKGLSIPVGPRDAGPVGTYIRRQMMDDRAWYGSDFVQEQMRRTGLDDFVGSRLLTSAESAFSLGAQRAVGERPFCRRECLLLRLCVADVLPLLGTQLASKDAPSVSALAPRLRQVLLGLFDGDSEKQIAARLKISRHTIHEYLRRLHQAFDVSSRGQLLARCARYLPVLQAIGDDESAAS
jgi:DNA-binding CsgD family transcriptional regulator